MLEARLVVGQCFRYKLLEPVPVFALDLMRPDPVVVKVNRTGDQRPSADQRRYELYSFYVGWKQEEKKQPAGSRHTPRCQL